MCEADCASLGRRSHLLCLPNWHEDYPWFGEQRWYLGGDGKVLGQAGVEMEGWLLQMVVQHNRGVRGEVEATKYYGHTQAVEASKQ